MSDQTISEHDIHIYRLNGWTIFLNIISLLSMVIVFGLPLFMFVMMLISIFNSKDFPIISNIAFTCFLFPIILLLIIGLAQVFLSCIASFFSYIKTSPYGLEQKNPIFKHIRCRWSDMDRIGKYMGFVDVVYLNSCEIVGLSLSLKSPLRSIQLKQNIIGLRGYTGWPEGDLAADLRKYAPSLFESATASQEKPAVNEEFFTSTISQENRLLAVLSHAAVLINGFGFVIPFLIYFLQKQKSSFTSFQSLQAGIWQVVASLFNAVGTICMILVIFFPAIFMANHVNRDTSIGLFFVLIFAIVLFLTFGNLFFIIYGLIGALIVYRGQDFQYILISKISKMLFSKFVPQKQFQ
jgi:hypothetical protein